MHISSGLRPAASERPAANNKRQTAACTRQHAGGSDWQCVLHGQRRPAKDRRQGTARGVRHWTCCSGRCNAAVVWPGAAGNGHAESLAHSIHRSTVLVNGLGSDTKKKVVSLHKPKTSTRNQSENKIQEQAQNPNLRRDCNLNTCSCKQQQK
jgi:hypothetical protein